MSTHHDHNPTHTADRDTDDYGCTVLRRPGDPLAPRPVAAEFAALAVRLRRQAGRPETATSLESEWYGKGLIEGAHQVAALAERLRGAS